MSASSADPSVLSLRGVSVDYPVDGGTIAALVDVDLDVRAGESVALLGASGAGKSTLLDVLAGLVRPVAGEVVVLGRTIGDLGGAALRRHRAEVGVIRQAHGLPEALRVIHNVNGGRLGSWSLARGLASLVVPLGRNEAEAALARVGLGGVGDRRTGDLSGGQQQRVAVARTLVQHPRLVLADEPVSAVDPRLSSDVVTLLCDLETDREDPGGQRGAAVLSLHDPDLARRHAQRIVGLRDGRIVFDLPAAAVSDHMLADLYQPA